MIKYFVKHLKDMQVECINNLIEAFNKTLCMQYFDI